MKEAGGLYLIYEDDNFHFMDTDERIFVGEYDIYAQALSACRSRVMKWLWEKMKENPELGGWGEALYEFYLSFGPDPFIVPRPPSRKKFSAWDYARKLCNLPEEWKPAPLPPTTWRPTDPLKPLHWTTIAKDGLYAFWILFQFVVLVPFYAFSCFFIPGKFRDRWADTLFRFSEEDIKELIGGEARE